jgi:hypothetical protein
MMRPSALEITAGDFALAGVIALSSTSVDQAPVLRRGQSDVKHTGGRRSWITYSISRSAPGARRCWRDCGP